MINNAERIKTIALEELCESGFTKTAKMLGSEDYFVSAIDIQYDDGTKERKVYVDFTRKMTYDTELYYGYTKSLHNWFQRNFQGG